MLNFIIKHTRQKWRQTINIQLSNSFWWRHAECGDETENRCNRVYLESKLNILDFYTKHIISIHEQIFVHNFKNGKQQTFSSDFYFGLASTMNTTSHNFENFLNGTSNSFPSSIKEKVSFGDENIMCIWKHDEW